MKIGIIGYGVVGKAVAHTLSKKYKIVKFDKYADYDKFEDLEHCDFIFICMLHFYCNYITVCSEINFLFVLSPGVEIADSLLYKKVFERKRTFVRETFYLLKVKFDWKLI